MIGGIRTKFGNLPHASQVFVIGTSLSLLAIVVTAFVVFLVGEVYSEQNDGKPIEQAVQVWGAAIATLVLLTTVAQVAATYLISHSLKMHGDRIEEANISRHINAQWQDFNKSVIIDSEFRSTLRRLEKYDIPDEKLQERYMIFIILNVLHDGFHGQLALGNSFDHVQENLNDQLTLLKRNQKEVTLEILDGNRGYDDRFIESCKKILTSS